MVWHLKMGAGVQKLEIFKVLRKKQKYFLIWGRNGQQKKGKNHDNFIFFVYLFCFGISAIFAPSISKLYCFLFKCWFPAKIWLKKCFHLTLPLEINLLTFSFHFWKKAGNSNLKIKLKKWLTDNRIWKANWYFEFEKRDHFWKA